MRIVVLHADRRWSAFCLKRMIFAELSGFGCYGTTSRRRVDLLWFCSWKCVHTCLIYPICCALSRILFAGSCFIAQLDSSWSHCAHCRFSNAGQFRQQAQFLYGMLSAERRSGTAFLNTFTDREVFSPTKLVAKITHGLRLTIAECRCFRLFKRC